MIPTNDTNDQVTTKPLLKKSSPTSVRCFIDEDVRTSLTSAIKPGSLFSPSDHSSSTCSSTTTSVSTSSRRRVSFKNIVRARDTISRHDMSEEEHEKCWIQDDEYEDIWQQNRRIVRRAKLFHAMGDPLPKKLPAKLEGFEDDIEETENGDFLCVRGLEPISSSQRKNSIERVLAEQDFQLIEGFWDEEAISDVYQAASSPCKFRAVYYALEDRLAVETDEAESESS